MNPQDAKERYLSLHDFELAAKKALPRPIYGYISNGCESNAAVANNRSAFSNYRFHTRVLHSVTQRTQATTIFGQTYASPFGIAPMGLCALSSYRGDVVLAQQAATHNIPMIVSATALISLEAMIKVNPHAWFQAYVPGEPAKILPLLDRTLISSLILVSF